MSTLPATTAGRLQRPGWRDARLILGIVLVLLAGALGAKAVASVDERSPMWALVVDVPAGAPLEQSMLRQVQARLDESVAPYFSADSSIPLGSITVRDLRSGELLPRSAVVPAVQGTTQRLNVSVSATNARGLTAGSRVDLYLSVKGDGERVETTRMLGSVAVADILTATGAMSTTRSTAVALLIPTADVQGLIEAIDNEAEVTLVPVAGALVRSTP